MKYCIGTVFFLFVFFPALNLYSQENIILSSFQPFESEKNPETEKEIHSILSEKIRNSGFTVQSPEGISLSERLAAAK
ncbi:MAG TPA: hypothetical protein PLJ29_19900, partial [Leptospiraceae bacterium]|nr:hypothetical protein [Leptospiraceae bacterium]